MVRKVKSAVQPRRRDFTRSSQELPDLTSSLLDSHPVHQADPRIMPRDPFFTLPNPHQRPATAQPFYSPHRSHGPSSDTISAAPFASHWTHAAPGLDCHGNLLCQQKTLPEGLDTDTGIRDTAGPATHSDRAQNRWQHNQQTSWPSANDMSTAASGHAQHAQHAAQRPANPVHSVLHVSTGRQHPSCASDASHHAERDAGWPVAAVRSGRSEQTHPGAVQECPKFHQILLGSPDTTTMHGPSSSSVMWQLHSQQQQQRQQPPISCFDWSHPKQQPGLQVTELANQLALSSAQQFGMHVHSIESTQPGPSRNDADADIAAMEAVLADCKALRAQITAAEAQIASMQSDVGRPQFGRMASRGGIMGPHHDSSRAQNANDQLQGVLQTLRELKSAAARKKPAVEAVAGQLRAALVRSCTHSKT